MGYKNPSAQLYLYTEIKAMPFFVKYHEGLQAVVLELTGRISIQSIREVALEVVRVCRETGCQRILNNASGADTRDLSFIDVYSSPEVLEECGILKTTKRAVVVPAIFNEARFLENVTRNRGHYIRVFWDLDTATAWLCGNE